MFLRVNGADVFVGPVWQGDREVEFDVSDLEIAGKVSLEISSDTFEAPGDPRRLGVCLHELAVSRHIVGPSGAKKAARRWYEAFPWSEQNIFFPGSSIRALYFTGGEPLLSNYMLATLEHLVETDAVSEIDLEFNTNGTIINERLLRTLPRFKRVQISLSIDALGKLNSYIRYPSNWTKIERNIATLRQMRSESESIRLTVHTTIQCYNLLHLRELIEWIEACAFDDYTMEIATDPSILSIPVLPQPLRALGAARLREATTKCRPGKKEYLTKIAKMIETSVDVSSESNLQAFCRFTEELDISRGQRLYDSCPELLMSIKNHLGSRLVTIDRTGRE